MKKEDIKKTVRQGYAEVALKESSCCGSGCCCGGGAPADISRKVGYSDEEMTTVPDGANLGLGCGNPVALASLKAGEVVVDLGSGAGFDCFLATQKVGVNGKVIGVDMTPEMLDKARANAAKEGITNVEFRLGEIENLPLANSSAGVIISNCVINLSPDKQRVFSEALRVLKPGGRLMVSDIVLLQELPSFIQSSMEAYVGCISGAILKEDYLGIIKKAGFNDIDVISEVVFPIDFLTGNPDIQAVIKKLAIPAEEMASIAASVVSISVTAHKPTK